jgi:two-component system response regulator BaeR
MPSHARRTVLVVENEPLVAGMLVDVLEASGYRVCWVTGGVEAERLLERVCPDLVILDTLVPDLDRPGLCATLLHTPHIPIAFAGPSARCGVILGLRLVPGGFVARRFAPDALQALAAEALRLTSSECGGVSGKGELVRIGWLAVDCDRPRATVRGQRLPLTPTEHRLLLALAHHPGQVLTRSELAHCLRDGSDVRGGHNLSMHLARLRAKLRNTGLAPMIVAVRDAGYRLVPARGRGAPEPMYPGHLGSDPPESESRATNGTAPQEPAPRRGSRV